MDAFDRFQDRFGYRFRDSRLLAQALTHSSYGNEQDAADNQTLEFLGDAVVDLVASQILIENCPDANEGELSRRRAAMVNEAALAVIGRQLDVGSVLRVGKGEIQPGGVVKPSLLADAVEALIGAVFQEAGYPACEQVVRRWLVFMQDENVAKGDPKSRLQMWAQKTHGIVPVYAVERQSGPSHEPKYEMTVSVQDRVLGRGAGRSKQEAEKQAATEALLELKDA
jgi:ribonuclease-3